MRLTRDFLFIDLRKKLTSKFRQVSSRHIFNGLNFLITIHDKTKSWIICLTKKNKNKTKTKTTTTKPRTSFHKLSVSYEKDTQKKDSKLNN